MKHKIVESQFYKMRRNIRHSASVIDGFQHRFRVKVEGNSSITARVTWPVQGIRNPNLSMGWPIYISSLY